VKILFYSTFGPFCLFAVGYVVRSMLVQHALVSAVDRIDGGLERKAYSPTSPEVQESFRTLKRFPVKAFLYCNQELLQDEEDDPRMARALALRKAVDWGMLSERRDVLRKITDSMSEEGRIPPDVLDEETRSVLATMVEERRANPELTYAERRVTDVLAWLAEGAETPPKGPEKQRVESLLDQYEKKEFVGEEKEALEALMAAWRDSSDPVAQSAAVEFARMLTGEQTSLDTAQAELCSGRADRWEDLYRQGAVFLADASGEVLTEIIEQELRLDHPHIYQYITLLGHRFEEVRERIREGMWMLRRRYYAIRFLSLFASRTSINPVMAAPTERLTREEHERLLRRANDRRMRECVGLLGRIGLDYVQNAEEYELARAEDRDEYVRRYIVHALEGLTEDERVGGMATDALAGIRGADNQRPGGPVLFTEEE
jgi:hypothetical protein